MNCEDLHSVLIQGAAPLNWPHALKDHIESCANCRALSAAWLQEPDVSAAPPTSAQPGPAASNVAPKTRVPNESPIAEVLLHDLRPVHPLPSRTITSLTLTMILLLSAGLLAAITGWHGWFKLTPVQRTLMLLWMGAAAVVQSTVVSAAMEPGAVNLRRSAWISGAIPVLLLSIPFGLLQWGPGEAFGSHAWLCFLRGVANSAAVLLCAGWLIRRGVFLWPASSGWFIGLLAGLGGLLSQELYCPVTESAHVLVAHIGDLLAAAGTGWLVGRWVGRR